MSDTRIDSLAEILREVSRCYESLHLLLETEREQFLSFDAEGLVGTIEEKAALLERLKRLERPLLEQKTELTKLWNLADETIGLAELLDQAPPDSSGTVRQLGARLLEGAQRVSVQLQRNRVMLEEGLAFVNDALASFQMAVTGESSVYAPSREGRKRKPCAVCLRREV